MTTVTTPHLVRLPRERNEELEDGLLAPQAQRVRLSRGRLRAEPPCPLRTDFQRDRDRVLHSKAFRRLTHKTQVFLSPEGDHYRTRISHTLEVSQLARTISRALRLNEDLTEAIALGHDLGHTPFGHAGEEVLNDLVPGGFRHYRQSLRVVDLIERDGRGLNLTEEVRNGILKHSKGKGTILTADPQRLPSTLEGQVVRLSDLVAYLNHDLDDGLRIGYIEEGQLIAHVPLFAEIQRSVVAAYPKLDEEARSAEVVRRMINRLATDLVDNSSRAIADRPVPPIPMKCTNGLLTQSVSGRPRAYKKTMITKIKAMTTETITPGKFPSHKAGGKAFNTRMAASPVSGSLMGEVI